MTAQGSPAPPGLDPRDLRRRLKTTADVLTRFSEMRELEDGYAFRFPSTRSWAEKLRTFREEWSASCPQMTFEIAPERDGEPLWLHIRGPEGTKQFVQGSRDVLTSNLNPAPSLMRDVRLGFRYLTSPLRVLPDFVIIGAKKCATTTLYSYLTQHPAVAPAFRKEIYYFNACWGKGPAWYRAFFPSVLERSAARLRGRPFLTGEATPDYLFDHHAPRRLAATIPDARLLAILRDPVDRAYSFYNHNRRAGLETLGFEEAVDREEERLAGEREKVQADEAYFSFAWEHHSYLTRGVYVDQLQHWAKFFPREQLLVLSTSRLTERPDETLRSALAFLDLPYAEPRAFEKLNAVPYEPMRADTRERLQEWFRPHNERLYEYLGHDLGWRDA